MPYTRESSAPVMFTLWTELFENQKRYTARLLDVMRGSTNSQSGTPRSSSSSLVEALPSDPADVRPSRGTAAKAPRSVSEFPIKRYDTLTVQEIAGKLDRLHDRRSLRAVMAYEAKNKGRKGVAAAVEARLERLRDQ